MAVASEPMNRELQSAARRIWRPQEIPDWYWKDLSEEEKAVYREYLPDPRKMPLEKPGSARNGPRTDRSAAGEIEVVDRDLAEPDIATDNGIADGDIRDGHARESSDDAIVGIDGIPLVPAQ